MVIFPNRYKHNDFICIVEMIGTIRIQRKPKISNEHNHYTGLVRVVDIYQEIK